MKRPLLFLFFLTVIVIFFLHPHTSQDDAIFPPGQYYTVTVHGRIHTYDHVSDFLSLTLTDCYIVYENHTYGCSRLLVTVSDLGLDVQAGYSLAVTGSLSPFQPARNPGNFNWQSYYRSRHISYRVYADEVIVTDHCVDPFRQGILTLRQYLAGRLQTLCVNDRDTAALLTGLLLGDKTHLEEETRAKYEDGGILHILAVSGLHVSLLGSAILTLGKKLSLPCWLRSLISGLLLLVYWQLCGAGISAGRAVIMFLCLMTAPFAARSYDSLSALSLSGLLILWTSPEVLFQAGFQLSFGAILGIQLACPAFSNVRRQDPHLQTRGSLPSHSGTFTTVTSTVSSAIVSLERSLRFGLGLHLTLLPITLYHFFQYSLYSIFVNLLVLPLATPLFLLSGSALLLSCVHSLPAIGISPLPWLEPLWTSIKSLIQSVLSCLVIPCQWILALYEQLCDIALSLPASTVLLGRPSWIRIALYYGLLAIYCRWKISVQNKHGSATASRSHQPIPSRPFLRRILSLSAVPLMLTVLLLPLPTQDLSVTFLDVGQGDCALLETPTGTTILIDCGSNDTADVATYRLIPFLESRAIRQLDYVFLSHTDEDHVNGVNAWLEHGGSIGTAILPDLPETLTSSPSYQAILALFDRYQIPVLTFHAGMVWQEGNLTLTCLAPLSPDIPASATYTDLNTSSQVLLAQYQGIRLLFTGDCEKAGEELLLKELSQKNITCHILKAGHHGSAYATSKELLQQLKPQIVIISCGVRNRYGHPHPATLERVEAQGSLCHVTASCGAILLRIHDGRIRLTTYLPPGPLYYR